MTTSVTSPTIAKQYIPLFFVFVDVKGSFVSDKAMGLFAFWIVFYLSMSSTICRYLLTYIDIQEPSRYPQVCWDL